MGARNLYSATNPKRIFDKMRECRSFLDEMTEHEKTGNTEKFLHILSAFLMSFRSIAYRLYGVTENQSSHDEMKALKEQLNDHPRIGYLIDRANLEVHGDGVVIWRRFNISVSEDMQQKWPPRWTHQSGHGTERWPPRYASRFQPTMQIQSIVGADWQFAGHSSNLLELCRNGLDEIEKLVKEKVTVVP